MGPTKSGRRPLEPWQRADAARLKRLFKARSELSQERFGRDYDIGTQGAVWQYLDGRIPLNLSVALKFAKGLKCSLREISPTLDADIAQSSRIAEAQSHYNVTTGPEFRAKVPLISWTTAGQWEDVRDNFPVGTGEEWVSTTANVGPRAFALRVVGDSMEPRIPDGAVVVIDPGRQYQHGSIVLAKRTIDQQATLKQLWYDGAVPKLRPLNERYSILEMPEDTRIIGVAVRVELDL